MNMLSQMKEGAVKAISHWRFVEDYAKVPHQKNEYKKQQLLLEELISLPESKKNKHIINLIQLIARNIQDYEEHYFSIKKPTNSEILKFLMDEHSLTQSDFPEIGSQSLVSKIFSGERNLTAEQIGKLAHRFHISPAVFYQI